MPIALNVVLLIFTCAYSVYILWQLAAWIFAPVYKPASDNFRTRVSLIIPCRNEEKNIGNCLASLLQQDYPSSLLEIIVADDHSEDRTAIICKEKLEKSKFSWKYVPVGEILSGKKKAIESGINASSGELIIITDADCTANKNWVSSIVSLYEEKNYQMICGPVAIVNEKNFCENFQALEFTGLSLLAGAGIFSGTPLICNGANLAYTRSAFEKVNGFEDISDSPSGDDTLLLFKINKQFPEQIGYTKSAESIVLTQAQPGWGSLLQQRIRWASKGFRSKNQLNSLISILVFVTNLLLLVCSICSLVYFSFNLVFILSIIVKFTTDFLLLTCGTNFFKRHQLLFYFLASEIVTMFYVSWVGLVANFSRYHWKGRDY
jgi:cellulose synthase/poly-beta-1,6-N-acetylglucosamine synthase-like glycosyltransferase